MNNEGTLYYQNHDGEWVKMSDGLEVVDVEPVNTSEFDILGVDLANGPDMTGISFTMEGKLSRSLLKITGQGMKLVKRDELYRKVNEAWLKKCRGDKY